MKIPNLHSFLAWLTQAKLSSWKATDKELTAATSPAGSVQVGSYQGSNPDGDEYKGIQVILPIPNPPTKKKKKK